MSKYATFLALVCCIISQVVIADEDPAVGKLLVATEEVQGPTFAETVILLIHHDETGAMGLVINRPAEVTPEDLLPELDGLADYTGTVYWGGPVRLASMRALLLTDNPPDDVIPVFDDVYRVPIDKKLPEDATSAENLRFFIDHAGWEAGQLDKELLFGSWHVIPATEDAVFTEDPSEIWRKLALRRHYRASAEELVQSNIWGRCQGEKSMYSAP